MNKILGNFRFAIIIGTLPFFSGATSAHESDDPLLTRVIIDQLEWRDADNADHYALEAQAWVGKDLHKLWLKTDVELAEGETEEREIQALYSRTITPYWDLQMGLRRDIKPAPTHNWGVLGVQGLAPYFYEVEAALFVSNSGASAARLSAEYELLLSQQVIFSPEITLNFYSQNDTQTLTGSGLADMQAGLRLRYEIRREFAPYIGINWNKKFGNTARLSRDNGEDTSNSEWVAGVRAWF